MQEVSMYSETLYHGSNRERGKQIIENQKMIITRGDNHWLGDGSYFFSEDFHSYKWILDMFNSRYNDAELNYESLTTYYLILKCTIETIGDRVFDLSKAEYKIIFDKVHKEMKKKKKIKNGDIAEGIVLNYMFNELKFAEEFDLVKAIFIMNTSHYRKVSTRLGYMPQEQICIKNLDIVDNIEEYDFKERVETFGILLNDYYFNSLNANSNQAYSSSRKPKYI